MELVFFWKKNTEKLCDCSVFYTEKMCAKLFIGIYCHLFNTFIKTFFVTMLPFFNFLQIISRSLCKYFSSIYYTFNKF